MNNISKEKLKIILDNHQHWIRKDTDGWENMRADLRGVNLYGADLSGVNLYGANLRGTDLYGTDLYGTDLRGAKNIPYVPMNCPDSGSFIGWKKAVKYKIAEVIVKIQITEDAKRSSATGRKCRCSKAIVLEFQDIEGNIIDIPNVRSHYDHDFIYRVGEIIEVNDFDDNRWNECASGVHFFINRQDAVDYEF